MLLERTEVTLLRKGGKGLVGTIANAEHHAELMLPFIAAMKKEVKKLGFATWRQGSNIHEFVTHDGRRFTLRPFGNRENDRGVWEYCGVRLSLRVSRSQEYRLIDIDNVDDVPKLLETMRMLATEELGDCRNGLTND